MRVVLAPDSFKGTVSAARAAAAVAIGWAAVRPADRLILSPMADGGEGTLDALAASTPGARRMSAQVAGPVGSPAGSHRVATHWLLLPPGPDRPDRSVGVVELAAVCGLTMLRQSAPMTAHTFGFGQLIAAALDFGVHRLLLALGGSASTDGGSGALSALGARFADTAGRPLGLGGGPLADIASADLDRLRPPPPGGARALVDVRSPLLGPDGAAAVFAPQKGATPLQVATLDDALTRYASLLPGDPAAPGAGAAGGTGFGLLTWGADLVPGAPAVAEALGLAGRLATADLVITGEGSFDSQSAAGKVPSHVAELAAAAGVPALLVAGRIAAPTAPFEAAVSLTDLAGSAAAAQTDAEHWLAAAGARLARGVPASIR